MINTNKKRNLDEVSLIRPILIVLLVLYHAFAPWCGAWESFEGFEDNQIYWWIGQFAYSFMLPAFCFVSGYVWSFQRESLEKKEDIKKLIVNKFKRLYIPCFLFSILYLLVVGEISGINRVNIINSLLGCFNGQGHLWFLPMLFWCFIFSWLLLNYMKSVKHSMIIVFFLSYLGFVKLPFQMGIALYYLLYFFLGYQFWINKSKITTKVNHIGVSWIWILFVTVFIIAMLALNKYIYPIYENANTYLKILLLCLTTSIRILYSIVGIFAIYISAVRFTSKHELPYWVYTIGSCCMGIYIFQQFILKILYYKCNWINIFDSDYIPWIAFSLSIVFSSGLTWVLRKTLVGKKVL